MGTEASRAGDGMGDLDSSLSRLGKTSKGASGGLGEVASGIRDIRTVAIGVAGIPALVAAIGGLAPVATAAAGATAQLALGLGQAAAGFGLIGGTATAGAVAGLKTYQAVVSQVVSDSRAAYEATHENAMAQLEQQRNTILNTQASINFNEELNQQIINLTKVEAAIGQKVLPAFTRLMDTWGNKIPELQKPLMNLVEGVTRIGESFGMALSRGEKFARLMDVFEFISRSGVKAAGVLRNIADVGLLWANQLIPAAERLQNRVALLVAEFQRWAQSIRGTQATLRIFTLLETRMNQTILIAKNLTLAFVDIFRSLNATGQVSGAMQGLVQLTAQFRELVKFGGQGSQAIQNFMRNAQPTLQALGRLALTVGKEFLILSNNIIKAGQSGGRIGILATVINSLTASVRPLRLLFQETFIALGPIFARLIPQVAEFARAFLGSSGPLVLFLNNVTRLLTMFNNLPGPVKNAIVQFVAFNSILRVMGGPSVLGAVGGLSTLGVNIAQTAAIAGAGAGKVGLFSRAIRFLGVAVRFMLGPWGLLIAAVVTGAVLIYKNWDKIVAVGKQLVNWFKQQFPGISKWIGATFKNAVKVAQRAWGAFVKFIRAQGQQVVNWFRQNWPLIQKTVSTVLKAIFSIVRAVFGPMYRFIQQNQKQILSVIKSVWTIIKTTISTIIKVVLGIIKATMQAITGDWKGAWETIKSILSTVWKAMQAIVKSYVNIIKQLISVAWNAIKAQTGTVWNGIKTLLGSIWDGIKSKAQSVWQSITTLITQAAIDAENAVRNTWNRMLDFVAGVLSQLGFKDAALDVRSGTIGQTQPTDNPNTKPVEHFARGGIRQQAPVGGVANTPHAVYGEAGEEAYVRTDKYTPQSARALAFATQRWAEQGWLNMMALGGTLPVSALSPEQQKAANAVEQKFPQTTQNTYVGHPGGQENSFDTWGSGGRGDPVGSTGDAVKSFLTGNFSPFNWLIWKGIYTTMSGSKPYWDTSDMHYDHVHFTRGSNLPGFNVGGVSIPNPKQLLFERLWKPVQSFADGAVNTLKSAPYVLSAAAGLVTSRGVDAMRQAIDAKIPDTIGAPSGSGTSGLGGQSTATGGNSAQNRAMGEKMLAASGVSGSWSALDSLWTKESGWNRFADNPTSSAYGIPQNINPSSYPPGGSKEEGSHAGPQIDWGLGYIKGRYGSTDNAWAHSQSTGWYHDGGFVRGKRGQNVPAVLQAGEYVIPSAIVRAFASGGIAGQGWNLVGGDSVLGIGGSAAKDALAASSLWRGLSVKIGSGGDVNASWSPGAAAGATGSGGGMRVDPEFQGTALGKYLWAHEIGHALGAGHAAGGLMGATVSVGEMPTSETISALNKLHGGPIQPHKGGTGSGAGRQVSGGSGAGGASTRSTSASGGASGGSASTSGISGVFGGQRSGGIAGGPTRSPGGGLGGGARGFRSGSLGRELGIDGLRGELAGLRHDLVSAGVPIREFAPKAHQQAMGQQAAGAHRWGNSTPGKDTINRQVDAKLKASDRRGAPPR